MTQSVKSPICPLLCLSAAACLLRAVTLSCSPVFESGHCCHCASAERPRRHCCGVELSQPTVLQATSKKREHLSPRGDVYLSKVSNNEENTHSHRRNHAHPHCVNSAHIVVLLLSFDLHLCPNLFSVWFDPADKYPLLRELPLPRQRRPARRT